MSEQTIRDLYAALHRHDGDAAAACYAPRATFQDPAFGKLAPGDVQLMWQMLSERSTDLTVQLHGCGLDAEAGWARWTARYTFGSSGRKVVNEIASRMTFQDGLIADQVDTFSLRRWGAQAMGLPGNVLGVVGLLGPVVRRKARAGLEEFRR